MMIVAESLAQATLQGAPLRAHIGKEIAAFDDLLHGERRRAGERMAHLCLTVRKVPEPRFTASKMRWLTSMAPMDAKETATQSLGDRHQIPRNPCLFAGVERPGPAHTAHHLVQNQQHAVTIADLADGFELARHRGHGNKGGNVCGPRSWHRARGPSAVRRP
jgi:hypothetical protein